MRLLLAFLRRDWQLATSYRLAGLLNVSGAFMTLTTFYFLARTVGETPLLRQGHGTDYFSFSLVGLAVVALLRSLQRRLGARLREAQLEGSLETLLATPHDTVKLLALLAAGPIATAFVQGLAVLAAGTVLYGARLSVAPLSLAVMLAATLLAFSALGMLSAAFILVFKRGDPLGFALDAVSYLLAGVVYPRAVLPPALQELGVLLPATHALGGLRAAMLQGAPLASVLPAAAALAGFAAVLWPLAVVAIRAARRRVETVGSLPHA